MWLRKTLWPALCLLICAARLPAQAAASDSATLTGITQRLLDAITSGDSAVWAPYLSERWFITDEEGRHLGRTEFLQGLHGLPAGQSGRLEMKGPRFAWAPGLAVLSYDIDERHDYHGQQLQTRFHATDTWVRSGGSWKMLASQVSALPTPIQGATVAGSTLNAYAGTYALTDTIALEIVTTDSGLFMRRAGRPQQRLFALDDRIFIRHGARGFWLFERDSAGAVTRLVNWRDNQPVTWRRRSGGRHQFK